MFFVCGLCYQKIQEDDLNDLLSLKNDSWLNTHHIPILNNFDQKKFFDGMKSHATQPENLILIARNLEKKPIGMFGIFNIDYISRTANVSWSLYSEFRGKKLGKSLVAGGVNICFQILNLRKLNCEILETNIASQKCATAANFVEEGLKRQAIFKLGKYIDSKVMGLLIDNFTHEEIKPFANLTN